jgi:signal transduction histidine kinase
MTEDIFQAADLPPRGIADAGTDRRHELRQWLGLPKDELAKSVAKLSDEEIVDRLKRAGELMAQNEARFSSMKEISSALGATIDIDELLVLIMQKVTNLMDAERSSLFLVDPETDELCDKYTQGLGDQEIELEPGEGIAGWVAKSGRSLNLREPYRDPRFDASVDAQTGYRTDSILAQCVRGQEGKVIGVIEVLNAHSGSFSTADEALLSAIASQVAIAIENTRLYQSMLNTNAELKETKQELEKKIAELDLLYEVERELSHAVDLNELVESITRKTLDLVNAQVSALTLKESDHLRAFVSVDGGDGSWEFSERTLDSEQGISSRAMESGEPVTCGTGTCDPVPDAVSQGMGVPVENAVAVPLFDEDECIGALMVANRLPEEDENGDPAPVGFSDDDTKVLTLIAGQIAGAVAARRHREEREKRERLAAIGQALSGVLHDLKNPASIINGYVQLMVKADDRDKREEYAESIDQQFDQFSQMTRELLVFARGETNVVYKDVDIGEFMGKVQQLLEQELEATDTKLSIDIDCTGKVRLDPAKVKRALLNLARNAADAMDGSGTVSIRVSLEPGQVLRFEVEDDGEGIPEGIRDNLYESFVTEGKQNGTGLGLSIVKKVVEDLNGTIDFETERGEGTIFRLRFPQGEQLPDASDEAA